MKRIRIALIVSAIMMMAFLSYGLLGTSNPKLSLVKDFYIHSTDSYDSAIAIANEYNLELYEYSEYGFSVFEADSASSDYLLDNGFSFNSYSIVEAPPWETSSDEDPYLKNQYGLEITSTIESWAVTEGSTDVTIAIIDTGIDIYHSEFEGRISSLSKNVVTNLTGLAAVDDDYGHGTMVAGIIGANKDNSIGIAGITQNTTLLVIKANQTGEGSFWDSDVIEGIYYAIEQGADVINLSLGSTYANPQTSAAIDVAIENGIVVVAASGNDGTDEANYPASFEAVISVSAIDSSYSIADYSNYGEQIDIAAPGSDILTTSIDNGYMYGSGTSFAAPHITGIIALFLSVNPDASVDEIKDKLFISANDLGSQGLDEYYGYGLINAYDFIASTYYTITYITTPGTPIEPDYVLSGSYLDTSIIPTLADSVFVGWYLDANFQTEFDDSVPITSNLTLYALYSDAYHTVRFITEGSEVADKIVEHDSVFVLPVSSLSGYRFLGWYLDEARSILYLTSPVIGDLTLYAKFEEIIYYDITYYVEGELYLQETYEENANVVLPNPSIYGYSFGGWYLDSEYVNEYLAESITSDLILYALLIPETYQVTLIADGNTTIVECNYLETPDILDPVKVGYDFAGWYLDLNFTERYFNQPLTGDITLYALFESQVYTIDLMILGEHYDYLYCEPGSTPTLPDIVVPGYEFEGWYTNSSFASVYTPSAINNDIILYGKYTETVYVVRFFDDSGALINSQNLTWGDNIIYPTTPVKTSTASFDFTFLHWTYSAVSAEESVDIYPVFEKIFIVSSVSLNPAVDTIFVGSEYLDESIIMNDASLMVVVESNLDTDTAGKYLISYQIYDEETLVYTLYRYVRVIETVQNIEIILNEGISTLYLGQPYEESGATTNYGTIIISGTVDTSTVGVYYILYQVEYDGILYSKTRIISVLDTSVLSVVVEVYAFNREDYDE